MFGHQIRSSNTEPPDQPPELTRYLIRTPGKTLRRILYFALVTATSAAGIAYMFNIMAAGGLTLLELSLLILFSMTFAWIVTAFWSGAVGFFIQLFKLDPLSLRRRLDVTEDSSSLNSQVAVVMPIYNEDTHRVIAGFEATLSDFEKTGQLDKFDFYLLSDTQDEAIIDAELRAWESLTQRLPQHSERLFYRRRQNNQGRKVGNLTDFCERWGSYYDHMIVLDADSLMSGECAIHLAKSVESNPKAGLVQTVPMPVRQTTFFGRFLQFAASLHSPMLATGLAFWQTDSANYWGHNAIIRISAFMDSCGLPPIPGKGPFSGDILSHDFVEAALLRRAGWHVYLLPDLQGSYEEVPSNLLEFATRDRRWVQGNLQHLALLTGRGLHGVSRLHFLFGAVAYITTLLWLLMLGLSTVDAIVRGLTSNTFFTSSYQLFPEWPQDNSALIYGMFYLTIGLLLLPKLMSLIVTLVHDRKSFGGALKLCWGAAWELFFSVLIAPLMMFFHSYFVVSVLLGKKVSWNAQAREGRTLPWEESVKRTALVTVLAVSWGAATWFLTPGFFWWLTPVLAGLVLAAPIVRYSSSLKLGQASKKAGVFISPSEVKPASVVTAVNNTLPTLKLPKRKARIIPRLLPSRWRTMPVQSFGDEPHSGTEDHDKRSEVVHANKSTKHHPRVAS